MINIESRTLHSWGKPRTGTSVKSIQWMALFQGHGQSESDQHLFYKSQESYDSHLVRFPKSEKNEAKCLSRYSCAVLRLNTGGKWYYSLAWPEGNDVFIEMWIMKNLLDLFLSVFMAIFTKRFSEILSQVKIRGGWLPLVACIPTHVKLVTGEARTHRADAPRETICGPVITQVYITKLFLSEATK